MARPVSTPERGAKLPAGQARQGQNIPGMVTVLGVSILLIALAFGAMVLFSSQTDAGKRDGSAQEMSTPVDVAPTPAQ